MPTDTLLANADGDHTDFTPSAGDRYDCVSDSLDGTYITSATPGHEGSFFYPDAPKAAVGVVSVKAGYRAYWSGGTQADVKMFARLANVDGTKDASQQLTNSAAEYVSGALARPGGGDWSVADVNGDFEVGVYLNNTTGGSSCRVTELRWLLKYTTVGGWHSIVVGILGPEAP